MALRIGIDTGGTFTDLVLLDTETGGLRFHKVASTPHDPGEALAAGVVEILVAAGVENRAVELLVHGTTVATNAVLQRRGAKAAFITTAGFRDVLHIQRQDRPRMYDLRSRRAEPLVPRALRFELDERVRFDGTVQKEIDKGELGRLIDTLRERDVEAVAVGLLHSYANPDHERRVGLALAEQLPDATVCLSHELVMEHGEYERFSTCAMNAFVQPIVQRYLERVETRLQAAGLTAPLLVMKSNGGVMSADAAARRCVDTILSGPAGGVVAGEAIAASREAPNLITADMGGTSFDVAVIHDGRVAFARDAEMAGLALKTPMLDIHTIGAGGGSIAWIDAGGALRVGPESAGANPGPACYAAGGDRPTVTDANLVLGRLGENSLLGGRLPLDVEAAQRAIHDHLALPLAIPPEAAAEGILRVACAAMTAAIRKVTVERGHDARRFTLCPFGGAGPLHAAQLARELGISDILIPLAPGVNSAVGLLMSRLREDRVRTVVKRLDELDWAATRAMLAELESDARVRLTSVAGDRPVVVRHWFGLRYEGQGYELQIDATDEHRGFTAYADAFHHEHRRRYGFDRRDQPVELVNLWASVEIDLGRAEMPSLSAGPSPEPLATRDVYYSGRPHATPVYARDSLPANWQITGPAIIEQLDATTVVWPEQNLSVDAHGQIILRGKT